MIEKLVLDMGINTMKKNFLALDDETKQKEFNKLLDKKIELQQENKQLKEQLENDIDRYEDTISYQLGYDNAKAFYEKILIELEEWLKERQDYAYEYENVLNKIQKLKEKYK